MQKNKESSQFSPRRTAETMARPMPSAAPSARTQPGPPITEARMKARAKSTASVRRK